MPKEYIPGVEKGYELVLTSGPLIGFPVVDFTVVLVDGKYHDVDSWRWPSKSPPAPASARP